MKSYCHLANTQVGPWGGGQLSGTERKKKGLKISQKQHQEVDNVQKMTSPSKGSEREGEKQTKIKEINVLDNEYC